MTAPETLRQWVTEHKVCWELSPLVELEQHPSQPPARVRVGFELQLFAQHAEGVKPSPACPECVTLTAEDCRRHEETGPRSSLSKRWTMKLRTRGKQAPRQTKRWAFWLFGLGAVALAVAGAVTFGRVGQAGTASPDSPEVTGRAVQYVGYDQSLTLTPEQERTRAAALGELPSPCCRNHTMAATCCRCTLSQSVSGLAKHLITSGYDAAHVRAEVLEWLRLADKESFPGHACSTRDGCRRAFNQHGCGGMDGRRSS